MSRTLTEIYNEAEREKDKYLHMTEMHNQSKMSVLNQFMWVVSACIHSFEALFDAFILDISNTFNNRINGTPAFYANSMLKWQYGDELVVSEDGTKFYYPSVDEGKRVISHVSHYTIYDPAYKDDMLILKVAKQGKNGLEKLTYDELVKARAYLGQIKFAGVKAKLVSRIGDVLVPKVTVYYDGSVTKEEMYTALEQSLHKFSNSMKFDSALYVQQVFDYLLSTPHVTDVYIDNSTQQGIYIAQSTDDDTLEPLKKVERKCQVSSGYVRESTKEEQAKDIPSYRNSLVLKLESEK